VTDEETSSEDRRARGMRRRRRVLGDEHVDAAIANTTPWDAPFQEYITGAAWADVWDRPGLGSAQRSLITIALLAALGHERELEMHLRASRRTGAQPEQVVEALLHVALYAGVPAANTAFAAFKRVMAEEVSDPADPAEPGDLAAPAAPAGPAEPADPADPTHPDR
jgi:4-carboxymuconolactone decarboxylase